MTARTPQEVTEALEFLNDVMAEAVSTSGNYDPEGFKRRAEHPIETIREALALMADPQWVYVPREPSEGMLEASQERLCQLRSITFFEDDVEIEKYKAMIAAAPEKGE